MNPRSHATLTCRYTELMDERVRGLLSKLDGATDEARLTLAQLGLPAALDALKPGKAEIPDDVRAALSDEFIASGGILNLQVRPPPSSLWMWQCLPPNG